MEMSRFEAIKAFFALPHPDGRPGRPVEIAELKALTNDERTELAVLSAAALNVTLKA